MKHLRLEELVQFALGKNVTRLKNSGNAIYTPEDFEKDLHSINQSKEASECIISMIKSKAAPVSKETENLCNTSNFLKCSFDSDTLDPWYFCYQFNEGREIEEQVVRYYQGNTLSVKKLTIQSIGGLTMPLLGIEQQHIVGELYRKAIIQRDLIIQQAENVMDMTLAMIRKYEEN